MKHFLTILLYFAIFINGKAQNVSKAYELLAKKEYVKANTIFKEAVSKNKDKLAAKYGLAILYSDTLFKKYSFLKAYKYINSAHRYLKKEQKKELLLKKYQIDYKSITNLRNNICEEAFNKIKDKNSITSLNNYISIYSKSNFTDKIIDKRDSIEYFNAIKSNDFREFQKFVIAHPKSKYAKLANENFEKLWREIYNEYASYGELKILNEFELEYPGYPFYNNVSEINKTLAKKSEALFLYKTYKPENESLYLQYIKDAAPRETAYLALMRIIQPYLAKKEYDKAISILNSNIIYFGGDDKRLKDLIIILEEPETGIKSQSISPIINTKAWEYSVAESADGNKIYFCGRNRPDNLAKENEDIFVSVKVNNKWTKPTLLKDINTVYGHEAPLSVTTDGNTLLLYSNSDIYFSDRIKGGWGAKKIFPSINTAHSWEADAMITADGKAVMFISDRDGNIGTHHPFGKKFHGRSTGNTDIYIAVKKDGIWGKPFNMGEIINTPFAERSPFLHSDMKTLYFSSDGQGGLGEFDVYMSKRLCDTSWTQWSEPINLGKEINTNDDEFGYKISTNGARAYFAGYQNNNFDIFYVSLPQKMRPESVTIVSGKIIDKEGNPIHATIKWENLETGEVVGFLKSNPDDGTFIIILPNGKNYGYFVEKIKYYPSSGNINLFEKQENSKVSKNITLYTINQILNDNVSIPLQNLFFNFNKFTIKKESYPELNRLADFINKNPNATFEISGHTDNKGSANYNLELSNSRANEVKKYLISKGCREKSLISIGLGQTKPIATNNTEKGRAINRRVEFKIKK